MPDRTTQVEPVAQAHTIVDVFCQECMRRYKISSNPHAEGIKYCPSCGEYVEAEYSVNSHDDSLDGHSVTSAVIDSRYRKKIRDRKRLF